MEVLIVFIIILVVLLVTGVHVGVALAATAVGLLAIFGGMPLEGIVSSAFKTVNNYALAAIPFFILGGDLIMHGGLADKLIQFIRVSMGKIQGGLGICVILASMFFAACNGSSVATCAALGRNTTELLEKEGYPKRITAGLVAVGGTLGLMFPPSLTMILIGVMQGIPIVTLFTAGIVPGILEATVLATVVWLLSKRFGWGKMPEVPEIKGEKPTTKLFYESIVVLLMPVIILGGIYSGFFTPTEAAAIASLYALILGIAIYRNMKGRELWLYFQNALKQSCMIYFIVIGGNLLGFALTSLGISSMLTNAVTSMGIQKWQFLLMANLILLGLGCLMDGISMIILTSPIIFPIAVALGINPIHLAVVMTANVEIATLTPPVGLNLYVMSGISGIPIHEVIRGVGWFYPVRLGVLLLITYIPSISLLLVS